MQPEYVLNGERFDTLDEFYVEVGRVFVNGELWGENLEALGILLYGGIRQIPNEFRLVWRHAQLSRERLGYPETVRQLTLQIRDCHPKVLIKTAWALRAALRQQGATVFDWIIQIVKEHPNVELLLVETESDHT